MKLLHYLSIVILIALPYGADVFGDEKSDDLSLYFTTLDDEQKLAGTGGPFLQHIDPQDVSMVTPMVAVLNSAEKIAPNTAWCTLAGDEDYDALYDEDPLTDHIDALLLFDEVDPPDGLHPTMRELAFSPSIALGPHVDPEGRRFLRGDVGRILRDGDYEFFLKAQHIVDAFGIVDQNGGAVKPVEINLDAIAYYYDPDPNARMIYFSLEEDQILTLDFSGALINYWAADGSILCIPGTAVTAWTTSGGVQGVTANSGLIVQFEPEVDIWVVNANVADCNGVQVTTIGDLDGLVLDPAGGMFVSPWGVYHNLYFCGTDLTHCGVLSTQAGGIIAQLNGSNLAAPMPGMTTGVQVGLQPEPPGQHGSSLNGLEITPEHCRFVLDGTVSVGPGPVWGSIEAGGVLGGMTLLGISAAPVGPGNVAGTVPGIPLFNHHCFPDMYPWGMPLIGIGIFVGPAGFLVMPFAYPGGYAGMAIVLQAYTTDYTDYRMSTPMTIQFY